MNILQRLKVLSAVAWLLAAIAVLVSAPAAQAQSGGVVNLELVLLVDVSASVNDEEYRLQASGIASAFRSRQVLDAINAMTPSGIAVSLIQWADHKSQFKSIDWTLLRNENDAYALAGEIAAMQRRTRVGHTAVGDALYAALEELNTNRYMGLRRVIDLSGDGRKNDGRTLRTAREDVLSHGITINGLAILNELPLLGKYFGKQLIGGEGAFVITADDYSDFARAMSEKLEREIRSAPLTNNTTPLAPPTRHAAQTPPGAGNPRP